MTRPSILNKGEALVLTNICICMFSASRDKNGLINPNLNGFDNKLFNLCILTQHFKTSGTEPARHDFNHQYLNTLRLSGHSDYPAFDSVSN